MSIDIVIKEFLARFSSFALLAIAAYSSVMALLKYFNIAKTTEVVTLSLVTTAFFYSLYGKLLSIISMKIRPRQDFKETFRNYTETQVVRTHNVKELANSIIHTLSESLMPQVCSLMLLDRQSRLYNVVAAAGMDEEIKSIAFKETNHLISALNNSHEIRIIVKDEVDKILPEDIARFVKRDLEILNAQICLPLKLKGELVGLLSLGAKASGELYTPEEMNFIFIFTNQSAMMLRFLEEIAEFERKLVRAERLAGITNLLVSFNHEIRNQLNSLYFFITAAQDLGTAEDRANYRKIAVNSHENIMAILNSVQEYHETCEATNLVSVNLNTLIARALAELKPKFDKIGAQVTAEIAANLPKIEALASFEYLLPNLLLNCYYALAQRETRFLSLKAYRTHDPQRPIEIIIADTGGDIRKMMIEESISSGGKEFPERANIGGVNFFIAKRIIEDHQGELVVEANPSFQADQPPGTTFTIRLPLKLVKIL